MLHLTLNRLADEMLSSRVTYNECVIYAYSDPEVSYLCQHPPGQCPLLVRGHGIQGALVQSGLVAGILIRRLGGVHLLEGQVWASLSIPLVHMGYHRLADVNVGQMFVANIIQLLTQLRVTATYHQYLDNSHNIMLRILIVSSHLNISCKHWIFRDVDSL